MNTNLYTLSIFIIFHPTTLYCINDLYYIINNDLYCINDLSCTNTPKKTVLSVWINLTEQKVKKVAFNAKT